MFVAGYCLHIEDFGKIHHINSGYHIVSHTDKDNAIASKLVKGTVHNHASGGKSVCIVGF
jgi:hypothetical protein